MNTKNAPEPATPAAARPTRSRRILWINLAAIGAFIVVVVVVALALRPAQPQAAPATDGSSTAVPVVRDDSHVLGEPGSTGVTFVEFLDFECEACGAAYPLIESLREQYAGRVTFVARYFPIPSHKNALNAAIAAEAAARQDRFEDMYRKLFDTQTQWGEQQDSRAPLFREYAIELGLDMTQYDADVADPTTEQRVLADQGDGTALGVQGTPTFFLDGKLLQPESAEDLVAALDEALGE